MLFPVSLSKAVVAHYQAIAFQIKQFWLIIGFKHKFEIFFSKKAFILLISKYL
jgi:hypothetical protein